MRWGAKNPNSNIQAPKKLREPNSNEWWWGRQGKSRAGKPSSNQARNKA
jgi:hypothetical protein